MSKKTNVKIKVSDSDALNITALKNYIPLELVQTSLAVAVAGSVDVGKCFKKGTKIMMYEGIIKNVEDIKVGDLLMGDDSNPRKVLETHRGKDQLYKILPQKGDAYVVNSKHILCLKYISGDSISYQGNLCTVRYFTLNEKNIPTVNYKYLKRNSRSKEIVNREANEILENLNKEKLNTGDIVEISVEDYLKLKPFIQNLLKWYRTGIDFGEKLLPLDPYKLGIWLGDGTSSKPVITSVDNEIISYYRNEVNKYDLKFEIYGQQNITYSTSQKNNSKKKNGNCFLNVLKDQNLINNKHIPDIYKYNTRANRLKLLAGLIDSYGYYSGEKNTYQFIMSSKYEKLVDDIIYLVRSLGFATYKYYKKSVCTNGKNGPVDTDTFRFEFGGIGQEEIPCLLERKKAKPRETIKSNMVTSFKIIRDDIGEYFGFGTDGNHRFLLGDFSVAHNSSLIGVLSSGKLDDGNGSARNLVARHPHEIESGRTSDVSTRMLYCGDGKALTLIDLCGHEKYLKTTTCGITGQFPDYAIVIIAANRGILKMTKEHLGILFYMQIPVILVITRADIAPPEIYNNTVKSIKTMCKFYNKTPEFINGLPDSNSNEKEPKDLLRVKELSQILQNTCDHIPVITVSNKSGYYVNVLRETLYGLQPRKLWDSSKLEGSVFYIDTVFNPPGIGLVLSGIVKGKKISVGDTVFIGPVGQNFIQIRIRSIHNNFRQSINELNDHERGCIAISSIGKQEITREMIHRGMIIVSSNKLIKNVCYRFKAEVEVLHHSATIGFGYAPVIHLGPVRQSARIVNIEEIIYKKALVETPENEESKNDRLTIRTGDKAIVIFKFKFKSEYIENGVTFFFREGTTRGVGKIISVTPVSEDPDANPDPIKVKRSRRFKRIKKDTVKNNTN